MALAESSGCAKESGEQTPALLSRLQDGKQENSLRVTLSSSNPIPDTVDNEEFNIIQNRKFQSESLPQGENVVLLESSFFQRHGATAKLPTPDEVRRIARESRNPRSKNDSRPPPVIIKSLGLLVKYGSEVSRAEGQCLLFVRKFLSSDIPVPEVYGWCRDEDQSFVHMEFIEGVTLEKRWDELDDEGKTAVCQQLKHMVKLWRDLKQEDISPFIGELSTLFLSHHIHRPGWHAAIARYYLREQLPLSNRHLS
jgi:hypothetical protein